MTCIVGLTHEGRVHMGSDSAGSDGFIYEVRQEPKVFKRNAGTDEMLFGYTTSFRFGQLLQFGLDIPDHHKNMTDHKYMVTVFMNAVRKTLSSGGYAEKDNEVETGGTALIGYHGKLWTMRDDYQIALSPQIGDSVGSGCYTAMGALQAIKDMAWSPKIRITRALKAAEAVIVTVRGPFHIISGAKYDQPTSK